MIKKWTYRGICWGLTLALLPAGLFAQALGTTARQLPKGSLKLLTYYQATEDQALNFSVRSDVGCAAAGAAFVCGQAGNVSVTGSGRAAMAKMVYQPWESFQYYASAGVGDYDVKVPSTTLTNLLTGDNPGGIFTVGLKWVFYPDTIVTPALAVDASVTRSRFYFNRRFPGGTPGVSGNINQRLDMVESQIAVETSHLFAIQERYRFEPYGGVKWSHTWSDLKDLISGDHAAGGHNAVRPFVGMRVPIFEHEGLFAEASFVDGTQYATGLEIRF